MNDVPHIGHAYTTVAGDVLTRWRRLWGDEVFYLTGTDEHGLKVQRAAEAQGVSPKELVDETARHFRDAWDLLDIAYDDFIRTTEPRHHRGGAGVPPEDLRRGDIELGTYEGLYCVSCEAYYTEDELVDGNCARSTLRPVEHVTEENYFFKLSRYGDRLLEYYAEHPEAVQPESRRNEVLGFIRGGLAGLLDEPHVDLRGACRCRGTRTTSRTCGPTRCSTTAPRSATATDADRFAKWWPVDYHLVGKDILRFHAVYWPAMLMSAGIEPPRCVFAHGWLLVGGEKMSKTRLNQIAPADLVADFGVDGFRYHFMADQRFGPDGDFSYEAMVQRYNADLANNFGNLANRVLNMAVNYCGGVVPEVRGDKLEDAATAAFAGLSDAMTRLDFASGFGAVWDLIRAANSYIEDTQAVGAQQGRRPRSGRGGDR